jgi:hypothetical protein
MKVFEKKPLKHRKKVEAIKNRLINRPTHSTLANQNTKSQVRKIILKNDESRYGT